MHGANDAWQIMAQMMRGARDVWHQRCPAPTVLGILMPDPGRPMLSQHDRETGGQGDRQGEEERERKKKKGGNRARGKRNWKRGGK